MNENKRVVRVRAHGGSAISLGVVIAVTISWSLNKGILWAVLHGIFGWFYVLYYALCLR